MTKHLARGGPRLAPQALHQLIRQRGLDACGDLVAAATPQQVAAILDVDLWRPSAAGRDEAFDAQRFGAWLEALMDESEDVAGRVVAEMDRNLAVAGISRFVRVFDAGVFEPAFSSDDEPAEVSRSSHVESEIGGYVVRARTTDAWDAIVGLLATMATDHPDAFHELMQGCRRLSNSTPEDDGLDDLLPAPDQLLHDVSIDREQRRTQQGYLTPGDARAFLEMARRPHAPAINPIAAAYFRALDEAASTATADAVMDLASDGEDHARPRALLGPAGGEVVHLAPIYPLMEHVHDEHPAAYFARTRELAFLANALLAGCSVYGRPFTVQESWSAAVGACNLGLELALGAAAGPMALPETYLADHDLVTAFQDGWQVMYERVTLFVTDRLIAALADLRSLDVDVERDLARLLRDLRRHREAGTPWMAGQALEVLAILDTPTWACLCGLLSECPVLPAALDAILEGRVPSFSATAFEPFATHAQIDKVGVVPVFHSFCGKQVRP